MDGYAPESRTDDEEAVRLAEGERPAAVCGHRGRQAGPRRDRVHRRASWAAIPRPSARAGRNWKARTTWTRVASEKRGRTQAVDRDRPRDRGELPARCSRTTPRATRCGSRCKWTNLSRRQIAERLAEAGHAGQRDVVSQLLRKHGYRRRKAQKKKTMGPRHPDRNAQFENIARLKQEYLAAGLPGRQHGHEEEGVDRRLLPRRGDRRRRGRSRSTTTTSAAWARAR